jgi:superfamily II DNA/RNA helicase
LQDCDLLINYDIHWNPVRVIKRFGRIDRIGSKNELIKLVNFWPTKDLNKYIDLEDRVKNRMHLLNIGSTGDENIFESEKQEENADKNELNFRHRQLLRLQDEVLDLEDMNESISLTDFSLSDFRVEIQNFISARCLQRG